MAHKDQTISGRWTTITFRQTAQTTGGALLQFEQTLAPGAPATVYHRHASQDERFVVISGLMGVRLNGVEQVLRAGQEVTVPQRAAHAMWNAADTPLVTLIELRPALSAETFFETIVGLERDGKLPAQGTPNPLRMALVLSAYGVELAAMPTSIQRIIFTALGSLGRLFGYRPWYPAYSPHGPVNSSAMVK